MYLASCGERGHGLAAHGHSSLPFDTPLHSPTPSSAGGLDRARAGGKLDLAHAGRVHLHSYPLASHTPSYRAVAGQRCSQFTARMWAGAHHSDGMALSSFSVQRPLFKFRGLIRRLTRLHKITRSQYHSSHIPTFLAHSHRVPIKLCCGFVAMGRWGEWGVCAVCHLFVCRSSVFGVWRAPALFVLIAIRVSRIPYQSISISAHQQQQQAMSRRRPVDPLPHAVCNALGHSSSSSSIPLFRSPCARCRPQSALCPVSCLPSLLLWLLALGQANVNSFNCFVSLSLSLSIAPAANTYAVYTLPTRLHDKHHSNVLLVQPPFDTARPRPLL